MNNNNMRAKMALYHSPEYQTSLESIGLSVQEFRIHFQDDDWWPSWISEPKDFSYFWFTSHPNTSYPISSPLDFQFRKSSSKYSCKMAAILDF